MQMRKRVERLRRFKAAKDTPVWTQPDRSTCEEFGGCTPLDVEGITAQFCTFQWFNDKYEIVDFSYEIQVRRPTDSAWCVAYRADAKHGTVHEHRFWPNGRETRKDLRWINDPGDVDVMSDILREKVAHDYESEIRRWTP